MTLHRRLRNVGLPFAAVGALFAGVALAADSYWMLLTGTAFVVVGLATASASVVPRGR